MADGQGRKRKTVLRFLRRDERVLKKETKLDYYSTVTSTPLTHTQWVSPQPPAVSTILEEALSDRIDWDPTWTPDMDTRSVSSSGEDETGEFSSEEEEDRESASEEEPREFDSDSDSEDQDYFPPICLRSGAVLPRGISFEDYPVVTLEESVHDEPDDDLNKPETVTPPDAAAVLIEEDVIGKPASIVYHDQETMEIISDSEIECDCGYQCLDVKWCHDYKTGDHQKDIRNEIPSQASPAIGPYMTTPISPNGLPNSGEDGWNTNFTPTSGTTGSTPDEAVKFIKNLKNIVIHLLNHQMVNTWKEDCNGCVTGHPSQKQHTCLYNYPEEYLQKNYDRVVRGLWNERLVDTVSRFLFAHGTPATNAHIQGAVEAILFKMQQAENIHQKLDEMYKNLPEDWITSAFMDTCLNMWRKKPDYQN
ncbi:hypothetical protein WMY93_015130 [Mugilogobius chulae]|uniref:Uncharacterized protein n=1 Tax=Mugilogobius chulae TaxID=88201 RepID=A0AAW0P0W6_9GOBI